VDEETGELMGKAPSHSLFFIPVEYWSVITLALFFWATLA
jgi:ATP/ADP translocase